MVQILVKCYCGETISYEIDENSLKSDFERMGIVPILVPHKDHFVTAYVDSQFVVRSVDRGGCRKNAESSVIAKSRAEQQDLDQIVKKYMEKYDPYNNFVFFMSHLLTEVTEPENLLLVGRKVGQYIWNKRREPIIKMGASFKIDPKLLLENEIIPSFEKVTKVEIVKGEDTIVIKDAISAGFMVGMAQGILDAIQNYMKKPVNISLEYIISGTTVFLTLKEAKI